MARVLYVEASPRKYPSASIEVARLFLDTYSGLHPEDAIDTLDVWGEELPAMEGETLDAQYAVLRGEHPTGSRARAWGRVTALCERLKSADKLLLATPMWNFSIPYRLKQFIDVVTQPGETFVGSTGSGYRGLLQGRPAVVIYARGGSYPGATAAEMDHQRPYVEFWLRFLGFESIRSILVEGLLGGDDEIRCSKSAAAERARELAREF